MKSSASSTKPRPKSAPSAAPKSTPKNPKCAWCSNILVSAMITSAGNPAAIVNAWLNGKFTLLTCATYVEKLRATLQKPRVAELIKPHKAVSAAEVRWTRCADGAGERAPQMRRRGADFMMAVLETFSRAVVRRSSLVW